MSLEALSILYLQSPSDLQIESHVAFSFPISLAGALSFACEYDCKVLCVVAVKLVMLQHVYTVLVLLISGASHADMSEVLKCEYDIRKPHKGCQEKMYTSNAVALY